MSRLGKKLELFAGDRCFRDSWEQVNELWGPDTEDRLWRVGSLIFKPEAIVGRRVESGLAFLKESGFTPVAARSIRFTPDSIEELARYQINVATPERIAVAHALTAAAPALYVLMLDERQPLDIPAPVRLVGVKGHVDPARRARHSLRSALGSVSRFLNPVHTPDEPADVVRELAVLFPRPVRAALLEQADAARDRIGDAAREARRLYESAPPHDLDFDRSLGRVEVAALARHPLPDAPTADALRELRRRCDDLRARRAGDSARLFDLADALGVDVEPWDWLVIAAELVQINLPGVEPTLPTVGREHWSGAA